MNFKTEVFILTTKYCKRTMQIMNILQTNKLVTKDLRVFVSQGHQKWSKERGIVRLNKQFRNFLTLVVRIFRWQINYGSVMLEERETKRHYTTVNTRNLQQN